MQVRPRPGAIRRPVRPPHRNIMPTSCKRQHAARRHPRARPDPRPRRPALHHDARRPRRRRPQGRAAGRGRRDARLGAAVRRPRARAPTSSASTATSSASPPTSTDRRRPRSARARSIAEADVVVENFRAGHARAARARPGRAARRAPAPRLVHDHRLRAGEPPPRLRLRGAGRVRVDGDHRRAGRRADEGRASPSSTSLAGKDAAIAILAALVGRGRRRRAAAGDRRHVHRLARRQRGRRARERRAERARRAGATPRRWGNAHANLVPVPAVRRRRPAARDRRRQRRAVARVRRARSASPSSADDPALATNAGRLAAPRRGSSRAMAERVRDAAGRRLARARSTRRACRPASCGPVLEALAEVEASPLTGVRAERSGRACGGRRRGSDEHGAAVRARGWEAFDAMRGLARGRGRRRRYPLSRPRVVHALVTAATCRAAVRARRYRPRAANGLCSLP